MELDRLGRLKDKAATDLPDEVKRHEQEYGRPASARSADYDEGINIAYKLAQSIVHDQSPA